jgi:hypothetical protein
MGGSVDPEFAGIFAGTDRALESLAVFIGPEAVARIARNFETLVPQAWSAQPATFLSGMESVVKQGLEDHEEPPNRTVLACVLRFLRGLYHSMRQAQREPTTLGSVEGRALLDYLRSSAASIGLDRFAEATIRAPGARSMSLMNGIAHLGAAAEANGSQDRMEAQLRTRARTFADAMESLTKPLWLALGRVTAALRSEPEPSWRYLGAARKGLERFWSTAPTEHPELIWLLEPRIVTIRNAVSHASDRFEPTTGEAIFAGSNDPEVRLTDEGLRQLADEHGRHCITTILAILSVLIEGVISRLKDQRWKLDETGPLLRLPPPDPVAQ